MRSGFVFAITILLAFAAGCRDLGADLPSTPPQEFGVAQGAFSLAVGESLIQVIAGGIAPYALLSVSDTSVASGIVKSDTLVVHGRSPGITSLVIGDNNLPRNTDTIAVTVVTPVSFANQVQPIFENLSYGCTGCHSGGTNGEGQLDLTRSVSWSFLVGQPERASPACDGLLRVDPGNSAQSVLYRRVSGFTCGERMPRLGNPVSQGDQILIRTWIDQGARNN